MLQFLANNWRKEIHWFPHLLFCGYSIPEFGKPAPGFELLWLARS
jgi:hypothetical protein